MNDPLLRALAEADVPPPPGAPFGAEALLAHAAARARRLALAAVAAVLLCAPVVWWLCAPAPTGEARRLDPAAELRQLGAELERLRAALEHTPRPDGGDPTLHLRCELAAARAGAFARGRPMETPR